MQLELFTDTVRVFPAKRVKRKKRTASKRRPAAVVLPFPPCRQRGFIEATARHMSALCSGSDDLTPEAVDFWHATTGDLFDCLGAAGLSQTHAMQLIVAFRDEVGVIMRAGRGKHVG